MIHYRNATLSELSQSLDWATEEGWNPGLDDAAAFFQADPRGFFVAVDEGDAPVASISVVNHTDHFAFLGLYIVRPAYRGQGIGLRLWQHALRHAGERTVGLDGVPEQQQNYVKSGFAHAGGTTRFSGVLTGRTDPEVRTASPADIPAMIAKEAEASGVAKHAYLQAWFTQSPNRKTFVIDGPQGLAGLCTVRVCRAGAKVGPLVADTRAIADRMIAQAAQIVDGPLTLDVPDTSSALHSLCQENGFEAGFQTARMYRGPFATTGHANFAVVSLELG